MHFNSEFINNYNLFVDFQKFDGHKNRQCFFIKVHLGDFREPLSSDKSYISGLGTYDA